LKVTFYQAFVMPSAVEAHTVTNKTASYFNAFQNYHPKKIPTV